MDAVWQRCILEVVHRTVHELQAQQRDSSPQAPQVPCMSSSPSPSPSRGESRPQHLATAANEAHAPSMISLPSATEAKSPHVTSEKPAALIDPSTTSSASVSTLARTSAREPSIPSRDRDRPALKECTPGSVEDAQGIDISFLAFTLLSSAIKEKIVAWGKRAKVHAEKNARSEPTLIDMGLALSLDKLNCNEPLLPLRDYLETIPSTIDALGRCEGQGSLKSCTGALQKSPLRNGDIVSTNVSIAGSIDEDGTDDGSLLRKRAKILMPTEGKAPPPADGVSPKPPHPPPSATNQQCSDACSLAFEKAPDTLPVPQSIPCILNDESLRRNRPSFMPSYLPEYPDAHTFVRTPVYEPLQTSYVEWRRERSYAVRLAEMSTVKMMERQERMALFPIRLIHELGNPLLLGVLEPKTPCFECLLYGKDFIPEEVDNETDPLTEVELENEAQITAASEARITKRIVLHE